jgi:hypothetical protein
VDSRLVLEGDTRLVATLGNAARDVADLRDGFDAAGQIVAAAGAAEAPVLTGALAGSLRGARAGRNAATITSPLVYAGPVHWGRPAHNMAANPFVLRAADLTEDRWTGAIVDDAQRVCNSVQGV